MRAANDWRGWLDELAAHGRAALSDAAGTRVWIAAERLPHFRGALAGARDRARHHRAGRLRQGMVARRGPGRDPARSARRPGAGDRGRARRSAWPAARGACRDAGGARDRRLCHARPLHRRRRRSTNGASAACSRASTATRSSGCGRRSSPCRPATSCASCSAGSVSRPTLRWRGRRRSTPSSASSKASRRPPPPGKARSCRRGSKDYDPSGSTRAAWRAMPPGAAAARAPRRRQADDRCARPDHAAAAPPCCAVAAQWPSRPTPARGRVLRRRLSSISLPPTAPPSSTSCVAACGLLRSQVEEALAELVALGLVTSDSFAGLRALLVPFAERKPGGTRRRRAAASAMEDSGRWSLVRSTASADRTVDASAVEHVARALLRRYGVVFWRLLEREASWLPPWRELLRVYRRLEGAARSAAAASSPASPASSSPCPRRSAPCAKCAAGRRPMNGRRCRAPIRSTSPAS